MLKAATYCNVSKRKEELSGRTCHEPTLLRVIGNCQQRKHAVQSNLTQSVYDPCFALHSLINGRLEVLPCLTFFPNLPFSSFLFRAFHLNSNLAHIVFGILPSSCCYHGYESSATPAQLLSLQ